MQSFSESDIERYLSFVETNATNVTGLQTDDGGDCYPFAEAVGPIVNYPEANRPQCQRPPTQDGFCAFVFEVGGSATECQGRRYSLVTFATEDEVPSTGVITHQGACGVCSSAQDLATRMKTVDTFRQDIAACQTQGGQNFTELQTCIEEVGFTSHCANLWAHFAATEPEVCADKCQGIDFDAPFNGPPPGCDLPECFQCTAVFIGDDLEQLAGRTMPNSGIVENVARPCTSFYPVVHDPCPVPKPPPGGGGGGGGDFCFPGEAMVQVRNKGATRMSDLQLGDDILVDHNGNFEPVYSFGHRSETEVAEYFLLYPSMLEVSSDHMVFVETKGAIPASMVQVGDKLVGGAPVSTITRVTRRGVFAPFTPSGTIVVNGVLASSYVSFQESNVLKIGSIAMPISYHWMAHRFHLPHRIWCYHLKRCETEETTERGISKWVHTPLRMTQWLLAQPPILMVVLMIPILLLLTIFAIVDTMLLYPMQLVALMCGLISLRQVNVRTKQV